MSIYELNSIVKKIDEKKLSDISDVLNKKEIICELDKIIILNN